nr:hypothetical protein BaRGS_010370 [Batillaria attramentaria]
MGCCSSQFTDLLEDNEESQLKEAIKEEEYLPRKQRDIIRSTWKEFLYGDYNKDAVHIFVSLFQERPETLELFDFVKNSTEQHLLHNKLLMIHVDNVVTNIDVMIDSLDDLPAVAILILFQVHPETLELFSFIDKSTMQHPLHNERFMAHVDYVMADIGMMTDNLDDLPDVAIHMYNMGKRHAVRGVKAEYFKDPVYSLQPGHPALLTLQVLSTVFVLGALARSR